MDTTTSPSKRPSDGSGDAPLTKVAAMDGVSSDPGSSAQDAGNMDTSSSMTDPVLIVPGPSTEDFEMILEATNTARGYMIQDAMITNFFLGQQGVAGYYDNYLVFHATHPAAEHNIFGTYHNVDQVLKLAASAIQEMTNNQNPNARRSVVLYTAVSTKTVRADKTNIGPWTGIPFLNDKGKQVFKVVDGTGSVQALRQCRSGKKQERDPESSLRFERRQVTLVNSKDQTDKLYDKSEEHALAVKSFIVDFSNFLPLIQAIIAKGTTIAGTKREPAKGELNQVKLTMATSIGTKRNMNPRVRGTVKERLTGGFKNSVQAMAFMGSTASTESVETALKALKHSLGRQGTAVKRAVQKVLGTLATTVTTPEGMEIVNYLRTQLSGEDSAHAAKQLIDHVLNAAPVATHTPRPVVAKCLGPFRLFANFGCGANSKEYSSNRVLAKRMEKARAGAEACRHFFTTVNMMSSLELNTLILSQLNVGFNPAVVAHACDLDPFHVAQYTSPFSNNCLNYACHTPDGCPSPVNTCYVPRKGVEIKRIPVQTGNQSTSAPDALTVKFNPTGSTGPLINPRVYMTGMGFSYTPMGTVEAIEAKAIRALKDGSMTQRANWISVDGSSSTDNEFSIFEDATHQTNGWLVKDGNVFVSKTKFYSLSDVLAAINSKKSNAVYNVQSTTESQELADNIPDIHVIGAPQGFD